jgi:hypothetical protein
MSKVDSEVLYLILTKVAAKEAFYTYDPKLLPTGQPAGTITHRQLGEAYERITGNRMSTRTNWNMPVDQLNALLARCGLPSLSPLLLTSAEAQAGPAARGAGPSVALLQTQAVKWPPFIALKGLYRKS